MRNIHHAHVLAYAYCSKRCIYLWLIWIEANVTVHPQWTCSCREEDTAGTPWPSELTVKYVSAISSLCFWPQSQGFLASSLFFIPFPFFIPSLRRKTKGKMEGSGGILSRGWGKGQVTLTDRLKYHSLPGARHRLWCSEGVCDKSGVILREPGRAAVSKESPGNKIDQVLFD